MVIDVITGMQFVEELKEVLKSHEALTEVWSGFISVHCRELSNGKLLAKWFKMSVLRSTKSTMFITLCKPQIVGQVQHNFTLKTKDIASQFSIKQFPISLRNMGTATILPSAKTALINC